MTQNEPNSPRQTDQLWRRLTAAAQEQALSTVPPPGFADRVLAAARQEPGLMLAEEPQRAIAAAAWFALAASLLVCVWSWPDLQATWRPAPEIASPLVSVEFGP
jgi:hypothetical protein